jgi:hypothetical protein
VARRNDISTAAARMTRRTILREWFPLCAGIYINIGKLLDDIRDPRGLNPPIKQVRIKKFGRFLKARYAGVNPRHARKGKLQSSPLVVINVLGVDVLVDGWHRVWRANRQKRKFLPAYVIDADTAKFYAVPMERMLRKLRGV